MAGFMLSSMARKSKGWRLQKDRRGGGAVYWTLVRGAGEARISVALGILELEEAQRCLESARQDEQRAGRHERLIWLGRKDRASLVRYLLDPDAGVEALLARARPEPQHMTLTEYRKAIFWEKRKSQTAESTWKKEALVWKQMERDRLGAVKLRRLTARHFEAYMERIRARGLSGRTQAIHKATYKALLDFAHRMGHIKEAHRFFRIRGSTKRVWAQEEPLTLDEVGRLLNATDPVHRCLFGLGIGQGLRPSELVRVRWEDVDLQEHSMEVRGSKTETSSAVIPLTPLAFQELRSWWMAQGQPDEGLLFTWNGEPLKTFKRSLAGAAKRAGIEKNVTPYLLRHSFATLAWTVGIEKDVARRIMRHTTSRMLDEVYCRPRPRDLVKKLADFKLPG